ncbi:LysR family transcriptional regulator, glycine cleavage system transcriptional activator [Ferrimonas marina]|uniref:LysR family transcriptional regulator, glycine cleavage system transcriptional activator n=2 Tax=Ferrimonas marina TaxID=299255 RepID=A0A1M5QYY8_9GAMM|nr:LysR family transcriptional regulator, glycine cleavage system transcriptional activator [Ferrimonas marina]
MKPYPALPHSHTAFKVYEAVARHLSFTQAAKELHVTQSAVSRQVKQLEHDLNASLILREHRRIRLTPQGQDLYERLRQHYGELESLISSWRGVQPQRIVIKAAVSYAMRSLMPLIPELNAHFSDYEIVVVPTMEETELDRAATDCDLHIFNSRQHGLYPDSERLRFVREEYMGPVCANRPDGDAADLASLLRQPRIHSTLGHHDWKAWLAVYGEDPGKGVRQTTFTTLDMALSASLAGHGATVTDLLLVLDELEQGYLCCPRHTPISHSAWRYYSYVFSPRQEVVALQRWIGEHALAQTQRLQRLAQTQQWQGVTG